MSEAEVFLKGKSPDEEALKRASLKVSETMIHRSGVRPSTSYKKPVVESLFIRAMKKALEE
jgi:CO/xanthine dehydrogenase FAD-binding subunit